MQPFPSELEQEDSLFLLQHSPSNLASGFSGNFISMAANGLWKNLWFHDSVFIIVIIIIIPGSVSLGGPLPSTDTGTILGPLSTNGGPISPLLDSVLNHHGVSSSVPNGLSSLARVDSVNQQLSVAESGHPRNHLKFELQGMSNLHPHSLPEYHDGLSNGHPFGSPSTMAANINSRPPEIIDGQQFRRVSPNGQSINGSIELNEGMIATIHFLLLCHLFLSFQLVCWLGSK